MMAAAAAFLAVRPRSVAEVRRRLRLQGYRHDLIETVVERFVGLGFLDDEAFARTWVESRDRARPRGERALRQELARKGIDRHTIEAVLAERAAPGERDGMPPVGASSAAIDAPEDGLGLSLGPDERAARRLLERHRRSLLRESDPRKRHQKAYALLARSGFDPEVSRDASLSFEESSEPTSAKNGSSADDDPDAV